MRPKILLGSFVENRTTHRLYVELELSDKKRQADYSFDAFDMKGGVYDGSQKCFAIVFQVYNTRRKDIVYSTPGCVDGNNDMYNKFKNCASPSLFRVLNELGRDFHLNDMKAGTPKQEAILKQDERWVDYDSAVKILTEYNMLIDPEHNYHYGSAWTYRKIPENVFEFLEKVIDCAKRQDLEGLNAINESVSMRNGGGKHLFEYREHAVDVSDIIQSVKQEKTAEQEIKSPKMGI